MVCKYIKSDYFRYSGVEDFKLFVFLKMYFCENGFKFQFWLRLCKSRNLMIRAISYLQWFRFSRKYSLYINPKTKIGYGLYLGHGLSIVINSTAEIGNNVNIGHFTTIGSNKGKAAIIGNNVYIAPNVSIVEDVTIGNNIIIGTGSIVLSNISDGCTCAGVPSRVINKISVNKFIKNMYYE
ncbi:serine acetyltransferase [Photobacterium damselae]|uniref:serine acetyltransferase n=1 Tax=Photobacterium damselae TaxID=38293 RepID=UPI00130212E7|nr:serine acetyltransferase [Photobacterium damselae]